MIIPSIGKQKIQYKDHSTIQFESLDFYLGLAKKIISKMAPKFFNGLSKDMLKSEDAIAFVANAVMMGDWRWEERENKSNKSLYSYRNQCGIWAMKTYITKQYKHRHNKKKIKPNYSLSYQDDDISLESIIADTSQQEPVDLIIEKESNSNREDLLNKLFDSDILSDKQKEHLRMYYFENMTLEKIGKHHNVTREAIRQSIKSAIKKIRELI